MAFPPFPRSPVDLLIGTWRCKTGKKDPTVHPIHRQGNHDSTTACRRASRLPLTHGCTHLGVQSRPKDGPANHWQRPVSGCQPLATVGKPETSRKTGKEGLQARSFGCSHAAPPVGAWLSLVERLLRVQEVAGSNPVAPTILILRRSPARHTWQSPSPDEGRGIPSRCLHPSEPFVFRVQTLP